MEALATSQLRCRAADQSTCPTMTIFDTATGLPSTVRIDDYVSQHFGYADKLEDWGYWHAIGWMALFIAVVRVLTTLAMAKIMHIKR